MSFWVILLYVFYLFWWRVSFLRVGLSFRYGGGDFLLNGESIGIKVFFFFGVGFLEVRIVGMRFLKEKDIRVSFLNVRFFGFYSIGGF